VSRTCNNNAKQSSTSKKTTKDKEKLPHVVKKSRMKGGLPPQNSCTSDGTYEGEMSKNKQYKTSITSHAGLTIEKDAFPEDLSNLIKIDIVGSKIKELNNDLLKLVNNHKTYKNLKEIIFVRSRRSKLNV
jgi:hypothetical protein